MSTRRPAPSIGSQMPTWFSDRTDGMSTVTAVRPYTGKYPQWYSWFVTLTAPRTNKGTLEIAV